MPDFGRILAGLNEAAIPYVLVGGLAVGVHGYARYTKDVDVIVAETPFGRLDLLPEGDSPLDYSTLRERAIRGVVDTTDVPIVDLQALVTLKQMAGRADDHRDLERLRIAHGELPPSLLDLDVS